MRNQKINIKEIEKIKKILTDEFHAGLDLKVQRLLELPVSYTSDAPSLNLGEATECFREGFFNSSIALSRSTLEQILKHKLSIDEKEIISLGCLIKLATAQGLLTKDLRAKAINIQKWGNAYMHSTKKKDTQYEQQKDRSKQVLLSLKDIIEFFYQK